MDHVHHDHENVYYDNDWVRKAIQINNSENIITLLSLIPKFKKWENSFKTINFDFEISSRSFFFASGLLLDSFGLYFNC